MEIRLLLEKYKKIGFSQKRIREITQDIFKEFSLIVTSDEVIVNQTELKINISGTKRTHFVLIKAKIEKRLQEELVKEGLLVTKIY